jgi:LytS/YehU family sensor histidine kinase
VYINLAAPFPKEVLPRLICNGLKLLNYMFVFYALYYLVFQKFWQKNIPALIGFIILVYALFTWFLHQINLTIFPHFGREDFFKEKAPHMLFMFSFYFFALAGGFAVSLFINRFSLSKLKAQAEKQNALISKEIFLLKSQFDFHLTFNFLNYIYAHIAKISEKAAEPIEMYADMLRYTLTIDPEHKVSLEEEIGYIRNFIEVQKLLSSNVHVGMLVKGDTEGKFMLPRLLITLVENAFFHGQVNNPEQPITISLNAETDTLGFTVTNAIGRKTAAGNKGIGLENLQDILDLFYPGKHELTLNREAKRFTARLQIDLT